MTDTEFETLLGSGESTWLDWKKDFSAGLRGGKQDPGWEKSRGELLKDLICIANGNDGRDRGYLVFGVRDDGTARTVTGISASFDDAMFQVWAENTFEPPPSFAYQQMSGSTGVIVGVFTIRRTAEYPHVVVSSVGGILHDGQVWFRRGTKNTIAHAGDLRAMFVGESPMIFGSTQDPVLDQFIKGLYTDDWVPFLPPARQKESGLGKGHEIVYWPGTRQEVWVGPKDQEQILMRRPRKR